MPKIENSFAKDTLDFSLFHPEFSIFVHNRKLEKITFLGKVIFSTVPMIRNSSKKRIIAKNSVFIDDIFSKLIGLMFSKKKNIGLIFKFDEEKTIALHMLFVFYPIDVLFLDKNRIVADIKEEFKPFTFCKSRKKAMYAIEVPNGTIKKTRTEIGDKIEF